MNDLTNKYNEMEALWNSFVENHFANSEKGNKAAGTRARTAVGDLKKLVTEYRKLSVDFNKKSK